MATIKDSAGNCLWKSYDMVDCGSGDNCVLDTTCTPAYSPSGCSSPCTGCLGSLLTQYFSSTPNHRMKGLGAGTSAYGDSVVTESGYSVTAGTEHIMRVGMSDVAIKVHTITSSDGLTTAKIGYQIASTTSTDRKTGNAFNVGSKAWLTDDGYHIFLKQ